MATVKEIIWKKKHYLNEVDWREKLLGFSLEVVSCQNKTQCVDNVHNAVRVLMSSTSSRRTSMVDVKLLLTDFYFHLNAIFITLRPNRDRQHKFCKNRFFAILKLAPVLSQKSEEIHLVRTFCSSTTKTTWSWSLFLLPDFNKNRGSFLWENIDLNLCSVFFFLIILQNRLDWAVTGRLARV